MLPVIGSGPSETGSRHRSQPIRMSTFQTTGTWSEQHHPNGLHLNSESSALDGIATGAGENEALQKDEQQQHGKD